MQLVLGGLTDYCIKTTLSTDFGEARQLNKVLKMALLVADVTAN